MSLFGQNGNNNSIARQPSKRQQEKAPEGQAPHTTNDADGNAGFGSSANGHAQGDSRFTEVM